MPWVFFNADFDFKPKPQVTIAYRAGQHLLVTTPCAEQAIAAGKAVRKAKAKNDDSRQTEPASTLPEAD